MGEAPEEGGDAPVKFAEEPPARGVEEFKDLASWSHQCPLILKVGRCSHTQPENIDPEAVGEFMEKLNETDPGCDRFRAIAEDEKVAGMGLDAAWLSKACGDNQTYTVGEGTKSYAVNVIKSLRWPGAVTVQKCGNYCNIYIGDAVKSCDPSFNPT